MGIRLITLPFLRDMRLEWKKMAFTGLLVILTSCAATKHMDKSVVEESNDATSTELSSQDNDVVETTDNDKVKTIIITEYVYDTIYQANRVAKVTEVHEEDRSKYRREDKTQLRDSVSQVASEARSVRNDIVDESKPTAGTYWRWFVFGFCAGVVVLILLKLAWKYLKTQFTGGLSWILK